MRRGVRFAAMGRGLLVLALLLAGGADAESARRVAVVIGQDVGLENEDVLDYAEADADRMHALLQDVGQVRPERAFLVKDANPHSVRQAMAEARGRIAELSRQGETALIVYVSAHADEQAIHLDGQLLPLSELHALVDQVPATLRWVIIDACRTAVRSHAKGGRPVPEVAIAPLSGAKVQGLMWMTAAGEGEPAQEWVRLKGSLFTHHLLAGMRGLADRNGDGAVSLSETYVYAFNHTVAQSAGSALGVQRPSFEMNLQGFGEFVVATPRALGGRIVLAPEMGGRIWVIDQGNEVIAELNKSPGERAEVAVAPGRYRVVRVQGAQSHVADVNLLFGGERPLADAQWVRVRTEQITSKGGAWAPLREYRLAAGYAVSSGSVSGLTVQHGAEVSARRDLNEWFLRARLGGTLGGFSASGSDISQREARVAFAGGWQIPFSKFIFSIGLEPQLSYVQQQVRGLSFDPEAGQLLPSTQLRSGWVWGGGAVGELALPLGDRWMVALELRAKALSVPLWNGASRLVFAPDAVASLGWMF